MLRIFLAAAPRADRAEHWVRHGADGKVSARGADVPSRWPADPNVEVVLAASLVRVVALALPPMPRNRLHAAVRYALEDQMATSPDEAAIAIAPEAETVIAAITSRALVDAIRAAGMRIARVVPESALARRSDGWTWYESAAGGGFVRRADGSAFAVGAADGELPAELEAALAAATHGGDLPAAVNVAFATNAQQLARWSQGAGVKFVAAPAWKWDEAAAATFASAPDFLAGDAIAKAPATTSNAARAFRPALLAGTAALALLAGGLLIERAWLALAQWQASRALVREAAAARLPNATSPDAAAVAIARSNAQARHRAGRSAPGDALPLLARAAPVVATLPPGTLKSATYANGTWTLELAAVDAQSLSRVARALSHAGIDAVSAPAAGGTRMRLALGASAH